jgi:hypothetical protein
MDPSSYSFQDDIWSLSPEVNFDLTTVFEFLSEPALSPCPVVHHGAFEKYVRDKEWSKPISGGICGNKMHKSVIAMLRNMKKDTTESGKAESSRGFRHMIRERQRREKLSQSYADLYAMLSCRSKVSA